MKAQFSSLGLYNVADASIEETNVQGRGGAVAPLLAIPLRLHIWHSALEPREGAQFLSLHGKLWTEGTQFSLSQPELINFTLQRRYNQLKDRLVYLEFPLDAARIEHIERQRNGGEVKFRLEAFFLVNRLLALNPIEDELKVTQAVWAIVETQQLQLQTDVVIPRDAWISRVLPHIGHGVVHVLEFPAAPLEACAELDHSFQALKQAQALHKTGLYDDAVGKCRVALDQFFELEEKTGVSKDGTQPLLRQVPRLKKVWETELGAATYTWLGGALGAIKGAANRAHHSPSAHYSQADSQMIIAITTALVAYAARTNQT
jgi:hypothetical protein